MSSPCSVCCDPSADEINASLCTTKSTREVARSFGIPASTLARHRKHVAIEQPAPPTATHTADIESLIASVRIKRGSNYSPQDIAAAGQIRSVAVALDADPTDTSLLREFRISLADYERRNADNGGDAQSLATFIAEALARNTREDDQ